MRVTAILFFTIVIVALIIWLFRATPEQTQDDILLGKNIYNRSCSTCHHLFEETVGGPMYGTLERIPNKKWLYEFIKNPGKMMRSDKYAGCLKRKYVSEMTPFYITTKEIDAIYLYVYSEAKKRKDIWGNKKFFEPCK